MELVHPNEGARSSFGRQRRSFSRAKPRLMRRQLKINPEIFVQLLSEISALQSGRRISISADFTLQEATGNGFFCVPPLRGSNAGGYEDIGLRKSEFLL